MPEVEKLYDRAGVRIVKPFRNNQIIFDSELQTGEEGVVIYNFTPEKQLELIKLFIPSVWWENLSEELSNIVNTEISFPEKLALFINKFWYNFSEEDREEIKGVLEK